MAVSKNLYKSLSEFPSVEIFSRHSSLTKYFVRLPEPIIIENVRQSLSELKKKFKSDGQAIAEKELVREVVSRLDDFLRYDLKRVLNGTGIIIHTNLGRSPLPAEIALQALSDATGYCNLEYDLKTGGRGRRGQIAERFLATLCRCEAGTLVNNNAAALFIILNSLASRKEVIISRGELVQIGGGFKIPEIMKKSGARLVEVGTTNRTSIDDYRKAITDRTRMILKVHRSNFVQEGFVAEALLPDLASLCREKNIISVNDLGSGLINFPRGINIKDETRVFDSVKSGFDLTCFSGDKLLGGVQAGMIVGQGDLIKRIKKNPLFRTMRCDKLTFSIVTRILHSYLNNNQFEDIPIWQMISTPLAQLKLRGEKILKEIGYPGVILAATRAYLGGGSTPERSIASLAISISSSRNPNRMADEFRTYDPPLIGRVENDRFLLDLRTIPSDFDQTLIKAIKKIAG